MARELASSLAHRFMDDVGSPDDWSVDIWSDGPVIAPDGEIEVLTTMALYRRTDDTRGFAVLTGATPDDEAQSEFVSQLHDVILEYSGGAALPRCPGHPHPQDPHVVDGALVWRCPARFGHLRPL